MEGKCHDYWVVVLLRECTRDRGMMLTLRAGKLNRMGGSELKPRDVANFTAESMALMCK